MSNISFLDEKMTDQTEDLSKRIELGKSSRHQIIFHKEAIDDAIAKGHSKKDVWKTLKKEGKFTRAYTCFVDAYNKLAKPKVPKNIEQPQPEQPKKIEVVSETKDKKPRGKKEFYHNPHPDKDKLI